VRRRAFEFFGGVPWRISYDNDRALVAEFLGAHQRRMTAGFLQLVSHYLFEPHFCQVRRGNEKGVAEGIVKYSRLNFLVPVPQVHIVGELNEQLLVQCREDRQRRLRGQSATKEILLLEDIAAFRALPAGDFDATRKVSTTASSLSLVRFDCNDYSVPVVKTLDTFKFKAQPSINRALVQQLTRGDSIDRRENVLLIGNSGTGKTHLASGLAFAACNPGRRVLFFTATGLVTRLLEKRKSGKWNGSASSWRTST